ncbi:ead/Ea22-like family protein [Citrobacter sp.]|uniref:ead/Ea22-like family protein n=1 Tax=Citrobacter sp. TaxID=1896336 RepID=UPI003A86CC55
MTTLNKQALREAAEKALPAMKRLLMMPNDELFDEVLLNVDGDVDAANAFNLIAVPEAMLALLDELERYKSREDRVTKLFLDNSTSWNKVYKKLEAAEKRIAELAAREVELPTFNIPVRFGAAMICVDMTEIKKRCVDAIRAAGIGVKGD